MYCQERNYCLHELDCLRDHQKRRMLAESILELITKMLEPVAEYRIEIGECALEGIRYVLSLQDRVRSLRVRSSPLTSQSIWHSRQNDWQSFSLRIFEDSDFNLRTCTVLKNNTAQVRSIVSLPCGQAPINILPTDRV